MNENASRGVTLKHPRLVLVVLTIITDVAAAVSVYWFLSGPFSLIPAIFLAVGVFFGAYFNWQVVRMLRHWKPADAHPQT